MRGGNEKGVVVGRANGKHKFSDMVLDLALHTGRGPEREGDVEKLDKVGNFGDNKGVIGEDARGMGEPPEGRPVGDRTINQAFQADLIHLRDSNQPPKKETQVLVGVSLLDVPPGTPVKVLEQGGRAQETGNITGTSTDNPGLVLVNPKTGGRPKPVDQTHRGPQAFEVVGTNSEVVSTSERLRVGKLVDLPEEHVVANDKKEGGEGTTLLHPPHDLDPTIFSPMKSRFHLDRVKKTLNQGREPGWEPCPADGFVDEGVINGVERLGGVHEQDENLSSSSPSSPSSTIL
jgi:hypothetical protein